MKQDFGYLRIPILKSILHPSERTKLVSLKTFRLRKPIRSDFLVPDSILEDSLNPVIRVMHDAK